MNGEDHAPTPLKLQPLNINCGDKAKRTPPWEPCDFEQVCQMVKAYNDSKQPKKKVPYSPRKQATPKQIPDPVAREAQHVMARGYAASIAKFEKDFAELVAKHDPDKNHPDIVKQFNTTCQHERWRDKLGGSPDPDRSRPGGMNPDHQHPAKLGADMAITALKWANSEVNQTVGPAMDAHKPDEFPDGFEAHASCNCPK
jgi:hypothetical protein